MGAERIQEILQRICRIVLTEDPENTIATGILVGESLVVTNKHVIEDQPPGTSFSVIFEKPPAAPIRVVGTEPAAHTIDAALLTLAEPLGSARGYESLTDAPGGDTVGAPIHVLGYPLGLTLRHTVGEILSAYDVNATVSHDAFTQPGNSGSPVFDSALRLLGVHFYNQDAQGSQMAAAWALPQVFPQIQPMPALAAPALTSPEIRELFAAAGVAYPYLRDTAVCDALIIYSSGITDPIGSLDLLWSNPALATISPHLLSSVQVLSVEAVRADPNGVRTQRLLKHAGVIVLFRQPGDSDDFTPVVEALNALPESKARTALITGGTSGSTPGALSEWQELSLLNTPERERVASAIARILRRQQTAERMPRPDALEVDEGIIPAYVATSPDWGEAEWKTYGYLLNELEREHVPLALSSPFLKADSFTQPTPESLVIVILPPGSTTHPFLDRPKERLLVWKNARSAPTQTGQTIPHLFIASEDDFIRKEAVPRARQNRRASDDAEPRFALIIYDNNDSLNVEQGIKSILRRKKTGWADAAWNTSVRSGIDETDIEISNECILAVGSDLKQAKILFRYVSSRMLDFNPDYKGFTCMLTPALNWNLGHRNWILVQSLADFEQRYAGNE